MSDRSEVYEGITIYANNVAGRPTDEVDNEFRLIKLAIDKKWLTTTPTGKAITQIKLIGPTHNTTKKPDGTIVADPSHLTLSTNPGKQKAHLYLNPTDGATSTAQTTLDKISW